jgi:PIN domain nuclease of toxin-antitoxin system
VTSRFVVDTHALVWHLTEPRRRGKAAVRAFTAIDSGRAQAHVPAIVLVEIALRHEKGRMKLGPAQVLDALAGHPGYSILPLDIDQAMRFTGAVALRDPMDRLILAAALATESRLISADETFDGHVERTWD